MILIRYCGGLGNQMFQYAFQTAIQEKYKGISVKADLSHYILNHEHNGFELEKFFQIRLQEAERKEIKKYSPYYMPSAEVLMMPKAIRNFVTERYQYRYTEQKKRKNPESFYRQEYHSSFEPKVFDLDRNKDWYLDGLWQNLRYLDGYEEKVRKAFTFHNEELYTAQDREWKEQIEKSNSVGIHIRRGDFVNSKFDICSEEYFRKAIKILNEQKEKLTLFFFSDDPDFVEERFTDLSNKVLIRHTAENSILDMEMLSLCRHKILSNSTFAFWAGWLGKKEGEAVIAPKYSLIKNGKKYGFVGSADWQYLEP